MEENKKDFIINEVIIKFLNIDETLKLGEYKILGPDEYLLKFELNKINYVLFFADYIGDDDKDWIINILRNEGIKSQEFIPLINDKTSYVCRPIKEEGPYQYENIFDDKYVCVRI